METKEKLICAAEKCLIDRGSHATCVKAIAECAGVNHGLIHHYFGSKEGLFIELAKRFFKTIKPDPDCSIESEQDVMNYLNENIIPSARMMLEFRSLSFHMPELESELILMAAELRSSLEDLLGIDKEPALILMSSVLGLGFHSLLEPSIDIDKHIETIVSLMIPNERSISL